jgi:hypothetical protein
MGVETPYGPGGTHVRPIPRRFESSERHETPGEGARSAVRRVRTAMAVLRPLEGRNGGVADSFVRLHKH